MNCRRSSSIKDSILMPPPKAVTNCSHFATSDTSEELKKNLKETTQNAFTNKKLYKDLIEELKNDDPKINLNSIPNFLNVNEIISNVNHQLNSSNSSGNLTNINNNNNTIQISTLATHNAASNLANNNLITCNHNICSLNNSMICQSNSIHTPLNNSSLRSNNSVSGIPNNNINGMLNSSNNKKHCLLNFYDIEDNSTIVNNCCSSQNTNSINNNLGGQNCFESRICKLLPPPRNPQEIQLFVDHVLSLLKKFRFKGSNYMSIELETRYQDYLNQALKAEYFKESIMKLQAKVHNIINNIFKSQQETQIRQRQLSVNLISSNNNSIIQSTNTLENQTQNPVNNFNNNTNLSLNYSDSKDKEGKESKELQRESILSNLSNNNNNNNNNPNTSKEIIFLSQKRRPLINELHYLRPNTNLNNMLLLTPNPLHHPPCVPFNNKLVSHSHLDNESSEADYSISNVNTNNESFSKPYDFCSGSVKSVTKVSYLHNNNNNNNTNTSSLNASNLEKELKKSSSQNKCGSPKIIF